MEKLSSGLKKVVWSRLHCRDPIRQRMSGASTSGVKADKLWVKCKWENIMVSFASCFMLGIFSSAWMLFFERHKTANCYFHIWRKAGVEHASFWNTWQVPEFLLEFFPSGFDATGGWLSLPQTLAPLWISPKWIELSANPPLSTGSFLIAWIQCGA